jgi:hypothetical protein
VAKEFATVTNRIDGYVQKQAAEYMQKNFNKQGL